VNQQVDMSAYIAAKSDQLNADDLMDSPKTITITKVTAAADSADQPVSVHYQGGEGRPFKPCKTCRRIMVAIWGKDASKYPGRSMTLYRDPEVQFGGMKVGGIRISHMSNMDGDKTVALLVTRGRKAPFKVQPLKVDAPKAEPTSEDAASKWANAYIAKLDDFTGIEALQAFADQKAAKLTELEAARPDLHEKVTEALATRTADLKAPARGFDDDDLVSADDASPGGNEPTASDSDAVHKERADAIINEINAAPSDKDVATIVSRAQLDAATLPDDQVVRIEIAADKRRNAIRKEQEAAKAKEAAE
jgi:hypothetical protein